MHPLQTAAHQLALAKGFWDSPVSLAEKVALIHAELSELLEAHRADPLAPCSKPVDLTCEQEELADCLLRLLDLAGYLGIDVVDAAAGEVPPLTGTTTSTMIAWAHRAVSDLLLVLCRPAPLSAVASALATVLTAIEDIAAARGIAVWDLAERKHAYNLTRPRKHGKHF